MCVLTFQAEPAVEEVSEEQVHNHDEEHHHHDEEPMPPMPVSVFFLFCHLQKPKVSRNEKKARKAILAHDVEEVPEIARVTFKRDEKTYLFVDYPTVYKSKNHNIYIVFGTIRIDNGESNALLQQAASQKFQAPEETEEKPAEEKPAEEKPAEEAEEVDETGINPEDVNFVMEQTKCTRAEAVKALRENEGDMINAVMALSK